MRLYSGKKIIIISVEFTDRQLKGENGTLLQDSYQLTFCSVVLIFPLIGNLSVNKFIKQCRLCINADVEQVIFAKQYTAKLVFVVG